MSTDEPTTADALATARAKFEATPGLPERLGLIDALLGVASARVASGDPAAAEPVLGDIGEHLDHGNRNDGDWQLRASSASRLRVAAAQMLGRHDEALAQLDTNLKSVVGTSPEADAARLSLLTASVQPQLALGQPMQAADTLATARQTLARMSRAIPERPAVIMSVNLLLQEAAVAMLGGAPDEAEVAFAEALTRIDRLGGSDLGDLRRRIVRNWSAALKAQGRDAEATALVGRTLLGARRHPGAFAP